MNIEQAFAELALTTKGYVEKKLSDFRSDLEKKMVDVLAALPVAKDGRDGVDGKAGDAGLNGKDGRDGVDGKNIDMETMQGLVDKAIARGTAAWALDFERRAQDTLQKAVDKLPVPQDGRDALELSDLDISDDGDGNVTLHFQRGLLEKKFTIRLPRFADRGVYGAEKSYQSGDGVTFGGDFWIAQKDAPVNRPGMDKSEWRLAVRKGRDARPAKKGAYRLESDE